MKYGPDKSPIRLFKQGKISSSFVRKMPVDKLKSIVSDDLSGKKGTRKDAFDDDFFR